VLRHQSSLSPQPIIHPTNTMTLALGSRRIIGRFVVSPPIPILSIRAQPVRYYTSLPILHPLSSRQLQCTLRLTTFSYSSKAAASTTVAKPNTTSQRLKWKVIARIAYYLRIPFLVLSVYSIGYQQVRMAFATNVLIYCTLIQKSDLTVPPQHINRG
jgi:hypothetical protein